MEKSARTTDNRIPKHALGLLIEGGLERARERLISDIRRRAQSTIDPFFATWPVDRLDRLGVTEIMAGVESANTSDVEAFLRLHPTVRAAANLFSSGKATTLSASFEHGLRIGEWSAHAPSGASVTVVATGDMIEIAHLVYATVDATAYPEHRGLLAAMRLMETDRRLGRDAFRLDLHVPTMKTFERIAIGVPRAFPDLGIACLARPDDPRQAAIFGTLGAGGTIDDLVQLEPGPAGRAMERAWSDFEYGGVPASEGIGKA